MSSGLRVGQQVGAAPPKTHGCAPLGSVSSRAVMR